jgi:hypothetical protein
LAERPSVLVTIDTEGDNEWVYARHPTHENIAAVPRLQRCLERIGARPTYLVTYTVAKDPRAVEILTEIRDRDAGEIGAHCHSWNNPPVEEPTGAQVFLNELDEERQRRNLEVLTEALTESFGARPTTFRAGRFGANAATIRCLHDLGYRVDSSVTPSISWRSTKGLPGGVGGPDYRGAPHEPYVVSLDDPCRPGDSGVLEIPVTMERTRRIPARVEHAISRFSHTGFVARVTKRLGLGRVLWFRPSFQSLEETVTAARLGHARGATVYNMLLHSSELMPGGSPYARTERDVSALLDRTERAVEFVMETADAVGRTLDECRRTVSERYAGVAGSVGSTGTMTHATR